MMKYRIGLLVAVWGFSFISVAHAATPAQFGLSEGMTISASGSSDPDVYIINDFGFKRLFLNPIIFSFYGQLGGFANIHAVSAAVRDAFPTSGLFRDCQVGSRHNDGKVYGVQISGEDAGILHWVNTSGAQAIADDPAFFSKVFCINDNEFNWYSKGTDYTSVSQVPNYSRQPGVSPTPQVIVSPSPTPLASFTPIPLPSPTRSPTATPIPEPIIQSVSPTSVKFSNQFRIYGTGFIANGISQIQSIQVGPTSWQTTTATNVQDTNTIITTMQASNIGTWDVSVTGLDGSVSTLPSAITITQ